MASLIQDKIDSKTKIVTRDKEHLLMRKGEITPEIITFINVYTPKNRIPKYLKQKVAKWKGEINNLKLTVGDFDNFDNGLNN